MAYDNLRTTDAELFKAMTTIRKYHGMLGVHCENGDMVNEMIAKLLAKGHVSPHYHPLSRPDAVEAEAARDFPVHACTDVTGFGLLGHALEMSGTERTLCLDTAQLPLLTEAYQYAEAFLATAAGQRNREFVAERVDVSAVSPAMQEILFDPQTSGGLLLSVAPAAAADCLVAIQKEDPIAAIIGEVCERTANQPVIIL